MADDTERLVLQMSADLRRFEREMARSRQVADRRLAEVETRARQADRNLSRIMDDAGRNMVGSLQRSLSAIAPTLAAAFSVDQVIKYADSYTQLQNRLKAAGLEGEALKRVEDALFETANRNGLQVQATAELYQRASLSRERLGASESELLALVSGTAAALKVQGTSAEAASGPLLQLGQVLGGAKVQAEEYNSLIDGLPVLLQAAAKGSDRFGGDVAKLTAAVKDGKVSSQEFFQALMRGFPEIEKQAGAAATTVGAALQTLDNEFGRFVGQADGSLSASARLAEGIIALSRNLDVVTQVVGAVAVVMGTRFVLAMTAGSGAMIANGLAAARLSVFQTAMTASMMGTTRAALVSTTAMRGFTAAIAANPVGALIVAVTALAAGIYLLKRRADEGSAALQAQKQQAELTKTATDSYREAVELARDANGDAKKAALELAEARRQETIQTIANTKEQLNNARATLAAARARQVSSEKYLNSLAGAALAGGGGMAGAAGQASVRSGRQAEVNDAQRVAAAYEADLARAESELAKVDALAKAPPTVVAPVAPDAPKASRSRSSTGPTPEELARQREMLALQGRIEVLRAQGRTADADASQRRLDILNLTKQYEDAGFENAKALAELQINSVARAEAAARGREAGREQAQKFLDMAIEGQRRQNDQLLDQVSLEAELARLSGDPRRIEQAERELYIEQRTNDLLRERTGLISDADRQSARRQASAEYARIDTADLTGRVRGEIVDGLRDGLRALAEGDVGGFFVSLADRFTDRILNNLAEDLADIVMDAFKGSSGGSGGNWLSAIFSTLAGKRATGGPVTAGQSYLVGERRPEVFVPNTAGTIIPSVNAAMAQTQKAASYQAAPVVRLIVDEGTMFATRVQQISGPISVQTAGMGVAYAQDQQRAAATRRRQSFVGG
ncbi:tape measure protein [Brevundimonas vesicularis]|uniref:Tape measure protein N-terminal domain-containing protein n=1 Tax=Brevundimonas vesicularis TaxID=41276 RepID=A0A1Z3U5E8_BREVE|nr:tape measure protein [Brevundimonas vesicularis]ASE38475.1 hypothetical protein CEP68_02555 [Brevundimonas vesicularis]